MEFKLNFSDLTYDAYFRRPLFQFVTNPVGVLDAIHSRISPKYPIASNDMLVDPGRTVGQVHARLSLFAGNGAVDITADAVGARFSNPRGSEDSQFIQDCIALVHDALDKFGGRPFREENVSLRIFGELTDGSEASAFLRTLYPHSKLAAPMGFPPDVDFIPGFVMDLFQDQERWQFNFSVSQATRSRQELFVASTVRFFENSRFVSIKDKADLFSVLVTAALNHVDLQPQSSESRK